MALGKGISKYPKNVSKSEIESVEGLYFICPRAIGSIEYGLTTFDMSVLITVLSYSSLIHKDMVSTPILSLDLIAELVIRSKSKKNKQKIADTLNRLNELEFVVVQFITDELFELYASVCEGYFKYYRKDFNRLMKLDSTSLIQKCLHISGIEFARLFGVRGGHDSYEKFVTYRSHDSLGALCGMSRPVISRTLAKLESEEIMASYNVKMSGGGAPSKSIRSRYIHRDILRKYVEKGMGTIYARVLDNKETKK